MSLGFQQVCLKRYIILVKLSHFFQCGYTDFNNLTKPFFVRGMLNTVC